MIQIYFIIERVTKALDVEYLYNNIISNLNWIDDLMLKIFLFLLNTGRESGA